MHLKLSNFESIIDIVENASILVKNFYNTGFAVKTKKDLSPLTQADITSHNFISSKLLALHPDIPILSEEDHNNFSLSSKNDMFWCLDPLDGTKEFIAKNDEFTINLALISNQKPIFGIVTHPVKEISFFGLSELGAFSKNFFCNIKNQIFVKKRISTLTYAVSRSHLDENTKKYISNGNILKVGSALKLTYVANGMVDEYPRFSPCMLWDLAAGHCIINQAGGSVKNLQGDEMTYNYHNLVNDSFIASNEGYD